MLKVASLETLTRIGFAARGLLYLMIGFVALNSGRGADQSEVLAYLDSGPGKVVLVLMAIGFVAYAVWRLSEALIDSEGHGTDAKGLAVRVGGAISGIIHLALGFSAMLLASGNGGQGGDETREGAATALGLPGGQALLTLVAVGLVTAGLYQVVKAVRLEFLRYVDPRCAQTRWMRWVGRVGYAARGIVFVTMGWFFWNAAMDARASEAGGTGEALSSLPEPLSIIVALGLMMFGLFSFVEARFRRINDPHVLDRLQAKVRAA